MQYNRNDCEVKQAADKQFSFQCLKKWRGLIREKQT